MRKINSKQQTIKANVSLSFKQFRLGLSVFFLGFVLLYISSELLLPSLNQEILALISVAMIALGFTIALAAELRFLLYRGIQFFSSKK